MALSVPHPLVRSFVVTPIAYVGALVVTILSPLLHLLLFVIDLIDRKNWRFTRVVGLGIAFCVVEFVGLTTAFLIWVASGFGLFISTEPIQRLNLRALSIWLEMITRAIKAFIGFDFAFPSADLMDGPTVVLSRHAGPGDALLIARSLLRDHRRKVRMLGTTKLLWDPFFNHLVNRLPFYFCDPDSRDPEVQLAQVRNAAATIEHDGAMIIFPEGGNFTPNRQRQALERLEEFGKEDRLERARRLKHVLPPRTGGTLAALEAAITAHVVFVAHVGLDDLLTLGDIWRSVPLRRTVRATYWYADRAGVKGDRPEMITWLYDQWEEVDAWIERESSVVIEEW